MQELLAAIGMTLSMMMKLELPQQPPVIEEKSIQEIRAAACNSKCDNVFVFTEPTTGKILVPKGVDWSMTIAQGELTHEVARYILTQHKIYSPSNSCSRNVELETAMRDIHWDYLRLMKQRNQYKGYGFPNEKKELAEHVFFCTPDDKIKPKKKDYKQGDKQPVPAGKPFDYENSI